MKSKLLLIPVFVAMLLVVLLGWLFLRPKPVGPAPDLITRQQAEVAVRGLLEQDESSDSIVAYFYPEVLQPGATVMGWGDDEASTTELATWSYFAWVDREPGNAFFAHPTQFVYIDAVNGETRVVEQEFWPIINGDSFEGGIDNWIMAEPSGPGQSAMDYWRSKMLRRVRSLVAREALAQAGSHIRITEESEYAPPGEYYALIVSGYGRNSWVFLDGAQMMYSALKGVGYDDDHITFLAQGKAQLDPDWNREGELKLVESEAVDGPTSEEGVEDAIEQFTQKMTKKDSLFVFVLAHGKKGKIAMGQPLRNSRSASLERALRGRADTMSSRNFSNALLGQMEACEVMVVFDSCYSGSHRPPLEGAYDPNRIKRLAAAHSTNNQTRSYGADLKYPDVPGQPLIASFDVAAPKTPVADPNPEDHGGEFSSGFIDKIDLTIFADIYGAGVLLDAASLNDVTEPFMWQVGEDEPCVPVASMVAPPEAPQTPPQTPEDEPLTTPGPGEVVEEEPAEPEQEPEPAKPKVRVIAHSGSYIPVEQLTSYNEIDCDCCDEEHWHAAAGTATTLDGQTVVDPYSGCGLGKVSEHPVIEVEAE